MSKKVLSLFLSIAAILIPVVILYLALASFGFEPLMTNSVSYDAKLKNFDERKDKHADLLAIGSSMTLNNLDSKVITDSVTQSYYNLASWGLQMDDIKKMLEFYVPIVKPRAVLIASSTRDFEAMGNETVKNYINTPECLKNFKPYFYYENFNPLLSIAARKKELIADRKMTDNYSSLAYDNNGGVLLNVSPANIASGGRWDAKFPFPTKFTEHQYKVLDSLAAFLNKQNIKLFFIQQPIRKAYQAFLKDPSILKHHFAVTEGIIKKNNGVYLNLIDMPEFATDKYFADQHHLMAAGAAIATKKTVGVMKEYFKK